MSHFYTKNCLKLFFIHLYDVKRRKQEASKENILPHEVTRFILTYLLTYLLTPWCRVLLEKLTGLQLVKKFPAFHGTRRFITALTSVRHLSLSWASPIQSIYPHPTSWRSILILSTHLRLGLPSGLLPSVIQINYLFLLFVMFVPKPSDGSLELKFVACSKQSVSSQSNVLCLTV